MDYRKLCSELLEINEKKLGKYTASDDDFRKMR